jgi:hypothetical protein
MTYDARIEMLKNVEMLFAAGALDPVAQSI